jgi:hypothetical protein
MRLRECIGANKAIGFKVQIQFQPLAPRAIDHELIWSLLGLCIVAGVPLWVWLFGPPPLRCSFHDITTYPCLTCGATRSLLALAHLHLWTAFRFNPLCAICWALWALYIPYGLIASFGKLPRLRLTLSNRDWLVLRFLAPLVVIANWAWLIWDKR